MDTGPCSMLPTSLIHLWLFLFCTFPALPAGSTWLSSHSTSSLLRKCLLVWIRSLVYLARFEFTTYHAARDGSNILIFLLSCYVWVSSGMTVCATLFMWCQQVVPVQIFGEYFTKLVSSRAYSQDFFFFSFSLKMHVCTCMCLCTHVVDNPRNTLCLQARTSQWPTVHQVSQAG